MLFELKNRWFFSICIKSPLKHLLRPLMDFENVGDFYVCLFVDFIKVENEVAQCNACSDS